MPPPAVYVFDAYGTLFDVHAAASAHRGAIGPAWDKLTQTWRAKHLEYTWINALCGRQPSFWSLTEQSLDYAIAACGGAGTSVRAELLASYRRMQPFAEVPGVLAKLKARGAATAILSNGDPDMLADAVAAAGLGANFDAVLSVRDAGIFKPDRRVYQLVVDRFQCDANAVSFQSANRWDVAGARGFGFRTLWVNRAGLPDEYPDLPADRTAADLTALLSTD